MHIFFSSSLVLVFVLHLYEVSVLKDSTKWEQWFIFALSNVQLADEYPDDFELAASQ